MGGCTAYLDSVVVTRECWAFSKYNVVSLRISYVSLLLYTCRRLHVLNNHNHMYYQSVFHTKLLEISGIFGAHL